MVKVFVLIQVILFFTVPCFGIPYTAVGNVDTQYYSKHQKKKLFKNLGCKYVNKMDVEYLDFDKLQPEQTEYYQTSATIINGNSLKYQKEVEEWLLAPMYLKWISTEVGYGIFASQDIKKGDFIGVYAGKLRVMKSAEEIPAENVDYAWYYPMNALDDRRLLIDGKYCGNELRFINHSTDPNTRCIDFLVEGVFYLGYVAIKDIAQDSELTVDYGCGYWDSRGVQPTKIT